MRLNLIEMGPEAGEPLVLLHGLFGQAGNFGAAQRALAASGRRVVAMDLRNHGVSPHATSMSYAEMAADVAETLDAIGATPADVLGHSMGGKAAMVLALTRPALVRRLVVADVAPVAYRHDQSRNVEAMRGLDLAGLSTRAEADRRLAATLPDPALRAFFLQSLDVRADPPRWKLNLDLLAAEMPKILGFPQVAGRFDGPALFLAGAQSDYVRPEHRPAILAAFPAARFAELKGAGHWLHAEKPRAFEETVRAFLDAPGQS